MNHTRFCRRRRRQTSSGIPIAFLFVGTVLALASPSRAYYFPWPGDSVEVNVENSKYGWLGLLAFIPILLLCVGGVLLRKSAWCQQKFPRLFVKKMSYTSRVNDARKTLRNTSNANTFLVPRWDQRDGKESPFSGRSCYKGSLSDSSRELNEQLELHLEFSKEGTNERNVYGTLRWKSDTDTHNTFAVDPQYDCPILEGKIGKDGSAYLIVNTMDLKNNAIMGATQVLFQGKFSMNDRDYDNGSLNAQETFTFDGLMFYSSGSTSWRKFRLESAHDNDNDMTSVQQSNDDVAGV
jgi:hypothetical protein